MKIFLAKNFLGVFAYDENGRMLEYRLFPKEPEKIAERLSESDEEKELRENLKSKYTEAEFESGGIANQMLQKDYRKLAIELKWASSQSELNQIMSRTNIILTKMKIKEEKRDRILMHAVTTLEEIEKDINILSEKLREWYGLYFPELSGSIASNEGFAETVSKSMNKEEIKDKHISSLARNSAGMNFTENDLKIIRDFSGNILGFIQTKRNIVDYIEKEAKYAMPNISAVAGPILACKLISLAGGLEKIARLPSSTIQLLGSEKALFRHLKGEGKAPKYGVLFGHPDVQRAPKELKGKVARAVAAKISLAAKTDFFSKDDRSEKMKEELVKQVNEILKIK